MSTSSSDCYLCGAHNEPDASYCERCNGQLLSLPSEEPSNAELSTTETLPEEEASNEVVDKPRRKVRRTRKGNIQDQRLSDALGLDTSIEIDDESDEADEDDSLVDTVVTSIPRATPSAEIPLIGTRAGAVSQSSMNDRELGKVAYAFLGALALATVWFGYNTLIREEPEPDSIAFTGTTTTSSTSTSTTEKPRRIWQLNEVDGQYSPVFVRVDLYDCTVELEAAEILEPFTRVVGVSVSTHNVLVDNAETGGQATAAVIRSRTGASRVAILQRTADGALIATSPRATSRNLAAGDQLSNTDTDSEFYVGYDLESNVVTTTQTRQSASSQLIVTQTGKAHTILIGESEFDFDSVAEVDTRLEIDPEIEIPATPNVCQSVAGLRPVGATNSLETLTSVPEPEPVETGDTE